MAAPDDSLSDDAMENFSNPVLLPPPQLNNLHEIDQMMRAAASTPPGRESLNKFILSEDYLRRVIPLVELAEDLEDLGSLHRLSSIMKTFILLNDTQLIELMMTDSLVDGVVGALECMDSQQETLPKANDVQTIRTFQITRHTIASTCRTNRDLRKSYLLKMIGSN